MNAKAAKPANHMMLFARFARFARVAFSPA
jgi:hypothetical protein